MISIQKGNPGLRYYRKQALTTVDSIANADATVYAYTFRNASTAPVYVNFYSIPAVAVTVGGISTSAVAKRIYVPGAVDSTHPGEKVMSPGAFPIRFCNGGLTIAPVLTDNDGAAAGGSVYVEIDWALNDEQLT